MTLILEVEYLSGVCYAAVGPDSEMPDWPPQPDRIFSALVAAWASRGESDREADALEWLESRPQPRITAPPARARTAPTSYVPPNDPRSDRKSGAATVMPHLRRRQPRRFPAVRLAEPVVRLVWEQTNLDDGTLQALQDVAADVSYVGHSASLTRCRFLMLPVEQAEQNTAAPMRVVYPGRMAELRRAFTSGRWPQPGSPARTLPSPTEASMNVFGDRWLILEHIGGTMPDLRASARVARTLRNAILSGYDQTGLRNAVPEAVSGHRPDGSVSSNPHLAIIPLSFVGFPHADGNVLGFAIVPPRTGAVLEDPDFRTALRAVARMDEERGRRVLTIKTSEGASSDHAFSIELSPSFEPPANLRSLDPRLYLKGAREFATVTPIVLDRHLKAKGDEREAEMRDLIAQACRNVGLPAPEVIVPAKHSAVEGAPSAYPSGSAPSWLRWRLPPSLASRQLTHAVIRFPQEVAGPVLLGAGRHFGLGLCRPLRPGRRDGDAVG